MTVMAAEAGAAHRQTGPGPRLIIAMVKGGLVGSHIALVMSVVASLVIWGPRAAGNAAVASAVTIVFFASGQAVEVVATELANATGLIVTISSFALRAAALGVVLWLAMGSTTADAALHPAGLMTGALSTTLGWVGGVVWVGRRQRVQVYDTAYTPPEEWDA